MQAFACGIDDTYLQKRHETRRALREVEDARHGPGAPSNGGNAPDLAICDTAGARRETARGRT